MSEWINIHNQIPKIGEEVLFFYDDQIHIGYIYNNESKPRKCEWYSYISKNSIIDLITWWMPLPKPPEENE